MAISDMQCRCLAFGMLFALQLVAAAAICPSPVNAETSDSGIEPRWAHGTVDDLLGSKTFARIRPSGLSRGTLTMPPAFGDLAFECRVGQAPILVASVQGLTIGSAFDPPKPVSVAIELKRVTTPGWLESLEEVTGPITDKFDDVEVARQAITGASRPVAGSFGGEIEITITGVDVYDLAASFREYPQVTVTVGNQSTWIPLTGVGEAMDSSGCPGSPP